MIALAAPYKSTARFTQNFADFFLIFSHYANTAAWCSALNERVEDKSFSADAVGDKSVTFDIRVILLNGVKVNVEVQLRNNHNMDKRSLYYWSKEYSSSLKAGQDYIELPSVVAINIVNFDCFAKGSYPALQGDKKGMNPETNTLPKQHTSSLQGEVVDYPQVKELNGVKPFHTCFHLREDQHRDLVLTDALEIHYEYGTIPQIRQR